MKLVSSAKFRYVKVSTKGRITIPKEIRDSLDLQEGDRVIFASENGQATMRKASKLSEILRRQKPWQENSVKLQKKMRKEWCNGNTYTDVLY